MLGVFSPQLPFSLLFTGIEVLKVESILPKVASLLSISFLHSFILRLLSFVHC